MTEKYQRPKEVQGIIFSEYSLPDENLKLIGFTCSVPGCNWLKGTSLEYFQALQEHGRHNLEKHIDDSTSRVIYNYKSK